MFHRNESLLRDGTGLAVAGATVTVYVNGTDANGNYTNATKATLYSANSAVPGNIIGNPVTTDVNGDYSYYIADGIYDEVARYGSITEVRSYIQMTDPFEMASAVTAAAALGMIFISLFTAAPTKSIPIGTDAVQTAGYATSGRGAATYVYDATVDAAYVALHPRSSFVSANGRGFRLAERIVDPTMFGGVPYNPTAEVDSSDALQGFFDHAKDPQTARSTIFNWSDDWMYSRTIYAAYWDGAEPNVDRNFICGSLRLAPLASLPGGVPLPYALEVAGFRQMWAGAIGLHETGPQQYNNGTYATRRFTRGVHIRCFGNSTMGDIWVDCARRDAVHFEGWEAGFTVNGIVFPVANSIGAKLGRVVGRFCGSGHIYNANQAPAAIVASAREQGRNTGAAWTAEVYDNVTAGQNNLDSQRTKITCGGGTTTAEIETNDQVWGRVELTAAIYGTIAADAGTSTVTWTAGDPTNLDGAGNGLQVGQLYPIFQGGENVGKRFRIVSFGGASNRTITLTRADPYTTDAVATHAATASATYVQYGQKSLHWVAQVIDATHFTVTPWVPAQVNSTFRVLTGAALKIEGDDIANIPVASVIGMNCGYAWYSKGNFAPKAGTVLGQTCGAPLRLADPSLAAHNGIEIAHGHSEACDFDLISGSYLVGGKINMESLFDTKKMVAYNPRGGFNEIEPSSPRSIGNGLMLFHGGVLLDMPVGGANESASGNTLVTNATRYRQHFAHVDNPTLTIGYDFEEARHFAKHHWAEVVWTGANGSDPNATGTFNLDAPLVALGWTYAGAFTGTSFAIANPSANVRLLFQYLLAAKKVSVTRLVGFDASGNLTVPGTATVVNPGHDSIILGDAFGRLALQNSNGYAFYFSTNGGGGGTLQYHKDFVGNGFLNLSANPINLQVDSATKAAISGTGIAVTGVVDASGNVTSSAGKIGYATGAGGTIAQGTSRATAVTLNKVTGKITLFSTTTAAGQLDSFTWNNSQLGATDTIGWTQLSGAGVYFVSAKNNGDGTAKVSVYTPAAVGAAEAPDFQFNIIQGKQA